MFLNILLAYLLSFITTTENPALLDQGMLMIGLVSNASISIVTLTFSLTVLSVQVAAQTYSPRLLDEFVKDPMSKIVISVNLGAYAYCFTMTNFIDTTTEDAEVPYVAIHLLAVHILLVLISFVSFIHLFINGFRIETILDRAKESSLKAARALSSHQSEGMGGDAIMPDVPNYAYKVMADRSGYVNCYYLEKLVPIAKELDICVRYNHQVGEFVQEGAIICHVWDAKTRDEPLLLKKRIIAHPTFGKRSNSERQNGGSTRSSVRELESGRPWMGHVEDRLGYFASQGILLSKKRSGDLDVTLGIQQLSDIAVRALSPGVNDPHSAIQCMDVLSSLLVTLAKMDLGIPNAVDNDGNVRLCATPRSYSFLLAMLDTIRRYGSTDLGVVRRGLRMCGDLGAILTRARRLDRVPAVFAQLEQWMIVAKNNFEGPELSSLQDLYDYLLQNIADADKLIIKKGQSAGKGIQELEITHKDEDTEGEGLMIRSVREMNAVKGTNVVVEIDAVETNAVMENSAVAEFLQKVLPVGKKAEPKAQ